MNNAIYIIGAGGLGREVLVTLKSTGYLEQYSKIGFIDNRNGSELGIEIVGTNEFLINIKETCDVVIAISNTKIRRNIINELGSIKNLNFITFVHPKASIYDPSNVKIGRGCFIAEGTILTTNITLEDFCFINVHSSLHHDCRLNENSVLMPGCRITGGAVIGKNTFIGNNFQISGNNIVADNSDLKL